MKNDRILIRESKLWPTRKLGVRIAQYSVWLIGIILRQTDRHIDRQSLSSVLVSVPERERERDTHTHTHTHTERHFFSERYDRHSDNREKADHFSRNKEQRKSEKKRKEKKRKPFTTQWRVWWRASAVFSKWSLDRYQLLFVPTLWSELRKKKSPGVVHGPWGGGGRGGGNKQATTRTGTPQGVPLFQTDCIFYILHLIKCNS